MNHLSASDADGIAFPGGEHSALPICKWLNGQRLIPVPPSSPPSGGTIKDIEDTSVRIEG
ncbi:MAG: hypothetical protein N4J56_007030 [Chroococcidiopsis sp. SAG 2025]|nr:hypothetical protein [Chroococcidiopsis sp. SAG 2025]